MIVEKDAKNVMFARSTFISLRYYEHSLTWLMEGNIPSNRKIRDFLLASVFVALGCGATRTRLVTDRHEFDTAMRASVRPTGDCF
jgi:hypothetical protein